MPFCAEQGRTVAQATMQAAQLSRRSLLKSAAALGAVGLAGPLYVRNAFSSSGELNFVGWSGYDFKAPFAAFTAELWTDAQTKGITRPTFDLALKGVTLDQRVIAATQRQPEYGKPVGDYVNAELLGNPKTQMIGNVIQNRYLSQNDYPTAAALSVTLMATIVILVSVYVRRSGTEELV